MSPPTALPRLDTLLALAAPGAHAVADIGYDHGLLLLRLGRAAPHVRLYGVEVQPGRADALRTRWPVQVQDLGARLTLLEGDGLEVLPAGAVDTVVIAGLSDRSIVRILERSRERLRGLRRLVLCPSRVEATLRPALPRLGLRTVEERIACERGKTWDVIAAEPGAPLAAATPAEERWGPLLVARRDPALRLHLEHLSRVYAPAFAHDLGGHRDAAGALSPLGEKLAMLPELRARAAGWDDAPVEARVDD